MIASNSRWIALLLALLVPVAAHADPPATPPTDEQLEAARALFHDARELHRVGKLKEAIDRALEAYRTASTPVTALEAGQLLVEAGRLVEARDIVRSVALLPTTRRESEKGARARQEAASLAATLDGRIPKVAVAERPAGVDVLLDGKPVAPSDSAAWQGVDPGAHLFVVRAEDRTCKTINVVLAEGDARTIDLHDVGASCKAEPAPPPPAESAASIAPPPPLRADADAASNGGSGSREPPMSATRWAGVAIAGAGAVGLAIGGYLALSAKGDYDAVSGECRPRCSQPAFDARQAARERADVATVVLIVGGAALAGGAVVFLLGGGSSQRVAIGPGTVHLTVGF
jgi:hypothetical protein